MLGQGEQILILESRRGQASRLSRDLRSSGYETLLTTSPLRALELLAGRKVNLVIVVAAASARSARSSGAAVAGIAAAGSENVGGRNEAGESSESKVQKLCRLLKSDSSGKSIPLLLVVAIWEEAALTHGLLGGADYILFAPYQPPDLLRSVRNALLNGAAAESAAEGPGVEIIHRDRMVTITAGPGRLARLLFSLYEDLRQTRALYSWRQTELQQLQEQLRRERRQTEREVLLHEMVRGMAHDFGNVIETIGTAAAVVGSACPQASPYRHALEAALAQGETLVSVLQNYVLFGEETLTMEPLDLGEVVREVVDGALLPLRAPNVDVQITNEALPPISSNRILLSRCLNNLIWNAVQAMPSGGTLSIVGCGKNDQALLEVSDTGPGIPAGAQEKIFDASYSTKIGHPGLGLSIVRSLLQRSGGEIRLVNRPGLGTTFRLAFPAARAASSPAPAWVRERSSVPAR